MDRPKLNFSVNIAMFVVLLGLIWTGILIYTVLPHGATLWGLNKHEFSDIHTHLGIALLILTGLHLWLHWKWFACRLTEIIKTSNQNNEQKREVHAMIIVFAILFFTIASLFLAKIQVVSSPDEHRQQREPQIQQSNK